MTKLGFYLAQKSVNKSEVARRSGLSKARMNELTLNERSHLRVEELYLIALAIDVEPGDLLDFVCAEIAMKHQLPLAAEEDIPYGPERKKQRKQK